METYEEQREGVKWQACGVETQAVQPALGVFERSEDVGPGEALIVSRITVRGKSVTNELAFLVREELGCVRVVVDEPVGCNGNNDCSKTFL